MLKILLMVIFLNIISFSKEIHLESTNDEDGSKYVFHCLDDNIVVDLETRFGEVIKNIKVGWENPNNAYHFELVKCKDYDQWSKL